MYKKLSEERDYYVAALEMWHKVQEQGIVPEDVARFKLHKPFMTRRQCVEYQQLKYAKKVVTNEQGQRRAIPSHANAVVLKTGEVKELDPWVELP
jgi:hypothetical protein